MSALMTAAGHGVLICNHNTREADCRATFDGLPGEEVESAEARARAAGWATVSGFGGMAHLCPRHA